MSEITNYDDIHSALSMILDREAPEQKEDVLAMLDDAMGNRADELVLDEDIRAFNDTAPENRQ